jgi:hypothetical protein
MAATLSTVQKKLNQRLKKTLLWQSGDDGGVAGLGTPSHLLSSPRRHFAFCWLVLCIFFRVFASLNTIACSAKMVADLSSKLSGSGHVGVF